MQYTFTYLYMERKNFLRRKKNKYNIYNIIIFNLKSMDYLLPQESFKVTDCNSSLDSCVAPTYLL